MSPRLVVVVAVALALLAVPEVAAAHPPRFQSGAAGIGDPYFPLAGNGGYDVRSYDIDVSYDPAKDQLAGTALVHARATQGLSRFDLDFEGLTVRSVRVNHRRASWTRDGQELVVTPARGIRKRASFTVRVTYEGVPSSVNSPTLGAEGFFHTHDGGIVVGQPDSARFWYPANEHPLDAASYRVRITVPAGLQAISNGDLVRSRTVGGWSTWTWRASPMASYLSFIAVGRFDVTRYSRDGIRFLDAIDPDLFAPIAPTTGDRFMFSGAGGGAGYRRLARTITVPASGATLSFRVNRSTLNDLDYFFVEAHTVGADDWTTLPDANGHTTRSTGSSCPDWLDFHPFLAHYESRTDDGGCSPMGTSGEWNAATGSGYAFEPWSVDLSRYAGKQVEVSITYATTGFFDFDGVYLDDIAVSSADGSTSFENDGDPLDGWTVPGAPAGSPGNDPDWTVLDTAEAPPSLGERAAASLAREPEALRFLAEQFGPYPFHQAGGVVDLVQVGFALETQTRPVYSPDFWVGDRVDQTDVVVHELAHQWTGDAVRLARWQDIWLNEGFATYAEWLWSEAQGRETPQQLFDDSVSQIPADDPFWSLTIGDPGPDALFAYPVYLRGAMTLQALRQRIGDEPFMRLLHLWIARYSGEAVTTDDFIALAESVSGQQLDDLFAEWLYTGAKPAGLPLAQLPDAAAASSDRRSSFLYDFAKR